MKNSHEYPSYADPDPGTWDDAAEQRATKDREWLEREVITPSQASEPVRTQTRSRFSPWIALLFLIGVWLTLTVGGMIWTAVGAISEPQHYDCLYSPGC